MVRQILLVLVGVVVAAGMPLADDPNSHGLDFVLRNLTALWGEVKDLRQELDYHIHHGLSDSHQNLNEILSEVQTLQHEHHVHHLQHPHEGHKHNEAALHCQLEPNVDLPESHVRGAIHISRRKDGSGPIFYDVNVEGFDVTKNGRVFGFHVHEQPTQEQHCNDVGGVLKPLPGFPGEHLGAVGDLTVDSEGKLRHVIIASLDEDLSGEKNIVGYPLVVHDLGLGDSSSSLYNGHLACCNIHMEPEQHSHASGH
ncbi:Extracellular superoxide dismutase [Cu-Zn]-like [Homarus americanus]|uniref:Extracellular superoxide dismutase [Cu-Zn]-like n=1 Tax=Homarus americanus TaxID=6706 RepID=A0A8J5KA45_HOMAM|nr:Extracellular superoxide dismutase [Cu-Zn]-like [Homarus americanus]